MMLFGVQLNQRIEGGKHSGRAVKLVKQQTCQEYLASRMDYFNHCEV